MPRIEGIGEESANYDNFVVKAQFIELLNGFLLLITDQHQYGIGTIALTSPPSNISGKAVSSPFNLFGLKHTLLANIVGKTASIKLKKPVISMILIKNSSIKPKIITETVINAVNKAINKILESEKDT